MLTKTKMQEIQDLKLQGYTKADIIRYYEAQGRKPPSRPTISKYYDMDVIPVLSLQNRKPLMRSLSAARSSGSLRRTVGKVSVCHLFTMSWKKNSSKTETMKNFPATSRLSGTTSIILRIPDRSTGNRSTAVSMIMFLIHHPGEQMLIDFGEETLSKTTHIHFMCLLLCYSRFLCVYAQDHKYNSEEACKAIYRSFCRLGGRPKELVIDQGAVFVASETYGEVIKTRTFEDFCTEQDIRLWVCNKTDPESKGPIENSVGFVKKNFFSARKVTCIDDVWRSLPGWLERKNQRIHRSTLRVPKSSLRQH